MHLLIYIRYLEPYMLFCHNLYAFYFDASDFGRVGILLKILFSMVFNSLLFV